MGLVTEAGRGCGQARGHAVEQQAAGQVDPAAGQVLMRADPELTAEHPHQVRRVGVDRLGGLPEGHLLAKAVVDQVAQPPGDIAARPAPGGRFRGGRPGPGEVTPQPFGHEGQPAFCLQLPAGLRERVVQLADAQAQDGVGQHRLVDRRADETGRQAGEVEVDDPLAET